MKSKEPWVAFFTNRLSFTVIITGPVVPPNFAAFHVTRGVQVDPEISLSANVLDLNLEARMHTPSSARPSLFGSD
jgi:hypothetical protein